jgi:osmotically-inducible protein OsmY
MDDQIVSAFCESYTFKTYLVHHAINTICQGGVVTLTGQVSQESDKYLAQETVASLPGVKGLDNRLTVSREGAEKSDASLKAKVIRLLALHGQGTGGSTQVDSKDGVITLSGVAASEAQMELVSQYAADTQGVLGITNLMTVAQAPAIPFAPVREPIDDASVTAQVRLTFLSHRSTATVHARVDTKDGVVTLSGLARSADEKTLAARVATDLNGVQGVVNNMIIAAAAGTGVRPRPVLNLRVVTAGN